MKYLRVLICGGGRKLKYFKAPTQRFYDGAPIANLSFNTKNKTYLFQLDFDGGFPPKEIEDFVNRTDYNC